MTQEREESSVSQDKSKINEVEMVVKDFQLLNIDHNVEIGATSMMPFMPESEPTNLTDSTTPLPVEAIDIYEVGQVSN